MLIVVLLAFKLIFPSSKSPLLLSVGCWENEIVLKKLCPAVAAPSLKVSVPNEPEGTTNAIALIAPLASTVVLVNAGNVAMLPGEPTPVATTLDCE